VDAFNRFEHEGWKRVADRYDSTWASSTRQFIGPLLDAAEVAAGMSVLDVACGPGYVSAAASERGPESALIAFCARPPILGVHERTQTPVSF
jgi:protein-L-isoaspartate O-methyltransferase